MKSTGINVGSVNLKDHESHKWCFSDSSYYDFICEKCGVPEGTRKATEPCEKKDKVA